MKQHVKLYLIFIALLFFISCMKTIKDDHFGEVGLQVENHLGVLVDTFKFSFNTSVGEDSIIITGLENLAISPLFFYDDIVYHYREKDDIFLINKGRFVIEEKLYYLSNCFCEPELISGEIPEGRLTVLLENIDKARGNIEYSIVRE